jgi:hypothetical protein
MESDPPPRLHCSSLTFLLRRQRDRVPTNPSKRAIRCTYTVYCKGYLQHEPDITNSHWMVARNPGYSLIRYPPAVWREIRAGTMSEVRRGENVVYTELEAVFPRAYSESCQVLLVLEIAAQPATRVRLGHLGE